MANPMHPLSDLVLTASGRLGRRAFLASALGLSGIWISYHQTLAPMAPGALTVLIGLGLAYMAACLINQRLHDLGISGWWTAGVMACLFLTKPGLAHPVSLVSLALLTLTSLYLGLMAGQTGCNRYGPAPRRLGPLHQGRSFTHGTKNSFERGL